MTMKGLSTLVVRLAALAAVMLAMSARAQTGSDIFLVRGFQPNNVYQINEYDSINTLNGNLIVRVPLGPEYKTNGTLKYSFALNYNGDFWWYIIHPNGPNTTALGPESRNFSLVVQALDGQGGGLEGTEAIPSGNAGIGWGVEVPGYGERHESANPNEPIIASFSDGKGDSHQLSPEMHKTFVPATLGANDPRRSVSYSYDSTYYRVRRGPATAEGKPTREVQSPDGLLYRFSCSAPSVADCGTWGRNSYLLDWIADPYGNVLLIERTVNGAPAPNPPSTGEWIWEYTEGTVPNGEGRTGNVYYSGTASERNSLKVTRRHWLHFDRYSTWQIRLTKAVLAGNGPADAVTYQLVYKEQKILRLPVYPHDCDGGASPCPSLTIQYEPDKSIKVSVLESVQLPGGAGNWKFDYYSGNLVDNKSTFARFDRDAYAGADPGTSSENDGLCCREWTLAGGVKLQQGDPDIIQPNVPTFYYEWKIPNGNAPPTVYPTSKIGGRLRRVHAPTGGGYRYVYGQRAYPTAGCHVPATERRNHPAVLMVGIAKRWQVDADGNPLGDAWVYHGSIYRGADFCSNYQGEFIASVLDPNGRLTLNFFNVKQRDAFFGAPISPVALEEEPSRIDPSRRLKLTSRVYQVDYGQYSADLFQKVRTLFPRYGGAGDPNATRLRSEYAEYVMSSSTCGFADSESYCEVYNLRRTGTLRTFEGEDVVNNVVAYIEDRLSGYDGLGNFRQAETVSNFRKLSQPVTGQLEKRVLFHSYNPSVAFNGTSNPTNLPALASPWITNLFDHMTRWEDGRIVHSRHLFDPSRGYLAAKRSVETYELAAAPATLAESVRPVTKKDFLVTYARSSIDSGSHPRTAVLESYFGGTHGNANGVLGLSWLDAQGRAATNGAVADYKIAQQYQFGARAKTEYIDPCDGVFLQTYAAVVNRHTGLPTTEIDSAGLQTSYTYDAVNRIRTVTPPGELAQTYTYSILTGTGARNNVTITRDNAATYTYDYDQLGRMTAEGHTLPNGNEPRTARRFFRYNVFGKPVWESTWQFRQAPPPNPNASDFYKRTFTYDTFQRVVQSMAPDNNVTDTLYKGERQTDTKYNNVQLQSGSVVWRTFNKDGFGRLSEASDGILHARYDYDAGDNIRTVELNGVGNAEPKQIHTFLHDGTGTLILAGHPELDTHTIRHERIDARGHARKVALRTGHTFGAAAVEDPSRTVLLGFDAAERPSFVRTTGDKKLKDYFYFPLNCTTTCTGGERTRLRETKRYNAVVNPKSLDQPMTVVVTEKYRYNSLTGRMTSTETMASGGAGTTPNTAYTFNMAGRLQYGYDTLGQLTTMTWPSDATNPALGPARSILNTWAESALTRVRQTAPVAIDRASLQYDDATGLPTQVTYGNSLSKDVIAIDSTGMPRVRKITWHWSGGRSEQGDYFYDGMENIKRIDRSNGGNDAYVYDVASRLVSATVSGKQQAYTYDAFGNLTAFGGQNARSHTVSSSTNRFLPGDQWMYDNGGNLTQMPDKRPGRNIAYRYDALNTMTRADTGEVAGGRVPGDFGRIFLYNVNDERVATIDYRDPAGIRERWSFRDAGNRVVRDLERTAGGPWAWTKDYIHRGNKVNTTVTPTAQGEAARDLRVDHLGTVRFITDAAAQKVDGDLLYMPFGEPPVKTPLAERLVFTGHERDDSGAASFEADLDYMHARYYSARMGRFLSIDPGRDITPEVPQSWNLYAYVRNNPVGASDPTGRAQAAGAPEISVVEATRVVNGEPISFQTVTYESQGQVVEQVTAAPMQLHLGNDVTVNGEVMASYFNEINVSADSRWQGDAQANPPVDPIMFAAHITAGLAMAPAGHASSTAFKQVTGRDVAEGSLHRVANGRGGVPNMQYVNPHTGRVATTFIGKAAFAQYQQQQKINFLRHLIFEVGAAAGTQTAEGLMHGSH
jgi:RHS repeat-associated protein